MDKESRRILTEQVRQLLKPLEGEKRTNPKDEAERIKELLFKGEGKHPIEQMIQATIKEEEEKEPHIFKSKCTRCLYKDGVRSILKFEGTTVSFTSFTRTETDYYKCPRCGEVESI